MNKAIWALGALLPLAAATPTLARDQLVRDQNDYADFDRYRPFRFQLEGGATVTQGTEEQKLNNGWNVGAGFTWYPTSNLPLGLRVDGSYSGFDARGAYLSQVAAQLQKPVNEGTVKIWGADVDLELDLKIGPTVKLYLLAGVGWYDEQDTFREERRVPGLECDWFGCVHGTTTVSSIVARNTTGIHSAKNAGLGVQFALGERVSFFMDARYLRISPKARKRDFLPIRFGLRF
jgi:opacity protein-like surface antigen